MNLYELLPLVADLAENTASKYRYSVNQWCRLGGPNAVDLQTSDFAAFRLAALKDGRKVSTINSTVRDVAALLRKSGRAVKPGKPLKDIPVCRAVPEDQHIAAAYQNAAAARWPNSPRTRTAGLRNVSNEDFWRAFLLVSYFTAMRLSDLQRFKVVEITASSIEVRSKKTGKPHSWPLPAVIANHLRPLLAIGSDKVFGLPKHSAKLIRRELKRISGGTLTPQALRRASVTTWTELSDTARIIVQGSGLGVTVHYVDQLRILKKLTPRFPFPLCSLPPELRDARKREECELLAVLERLPTDRIADVIRVVRAFTG